MDKNTTIYNNPVSIVDTLSLHFYVDFQQLHSRLLIFDTRKYFCLLLNLAILEWNEFVEFVWTSLVTYMQVTRK